MSIARTLPEWKQSLKYSVSVQPSCSNPCPCSTMKVNWPHWTLKRKHIKLLSPLPVSFNWGWTRFPLAVLPLFCRSLSWRQIVIWRGSVAPGQVSPRLSPTLWPPGKQRSRMREGEWKELLLWFMTRRSYRIPPDQEWFLLQRWRYTNADPPVPPANVGLKFQPFRRRSLAESKVQ